MLARLNFNICVPTGYHFLARYLDAIAASERTRCLAQYYSERNMQEYDVLRFKPHVYAASSVYLALVQQVQHSGVGAGAGGDDRGAVAAAAAESSCWPQLLKDESGLLEADLVPCAKVLLRHLREEPETASKRRLNACRKKFGTEKYLFVSAAPLPSVL